MKEKGKYLQIVRRKKEENNVNTDELNQSRGRECCGEFCESSRR